MAVRVGPPFENHNAGLQAHNNQVPALSNMKGTTQMTSALRAWNVQGYVAYMIVV